MSVGSQVQNLRIPKLENDKTNAETNALLSALPNQVFQQKENSGGHALRKLKEQYDELMSQKLEQEHLINSLKDSVKNLNLENRSLTYEVHLKNDKIAKIKQLETINNRYHRTQEESEELLINESHRRIKLEFEVEKLIQKNKLLDDKLDSVKNLLRIKTEEAEKYEKIQGQQKNVINEQNLVIRDRDFEIDELKVGLVKQTRRTNELDSLIGELLEANKEVTANYQVIKKNHDLKRSEFEQLANELEEAKNACQMAIRQKKQLQIEMNAAIKQKQEIMEKNKSLEATLSRKEKDIADLLTKVNDTITDYELKLERKEEQLWAMSLQMTEETQKQKTHMNLDPDLINDIENKWKAKEKELVTEIETLNQKIRSKEQIIKSLNSNVSDLNTKQFQPRMERLKTIEKDIKSRMEEYALAEERMETGFLCPRDLKFLKSPMTLIPCGHTYCKDCVEEIKEENYNKLKCLVCDESVKNVFKNQQIELIAEQFLRRKTLTLSFLEW
ncbi:hypothetical protein HK098_003412 [Nowakowskiella sp. JEL0407]|nr:hypothetical protein HK098_003412 [Nowakowskiella sp. JEL0407]